MNPNLLDLLIITTHRETPIMTAPTTVPSYQRHFPHLTNSIITEFYRVNQPWSAGGLLIVFGDGEMGWYDWMAINAAGKLLHRTADQYGSPEVALRDALIWATSDSGPTITLA